MISCSADARSALQNSQGLLIKVHEVKMPGGARTQLTFFPDRVAGAAYHPHAGDYFVFSKDVVVGEWYQLYRYDVASGDSVS